MKASAFKLPEISRREFFLWLLRCRRRHRVKGASMFPLLKPGDEILYDFSAYRRKGPDVGDIVVARHPARRDLKIVKRVSRAREDGTYDLQGENPFESTDFKMVPPGKILGKVTCIFYPAASKDEQKKNKVD